MYIDNTLIDSNYIKYSYKYDLISIVKGYGTYKENPKPNFDINIPVDNISHGKHAIRIEFELEDGTNMQKVQGSIYVDKSIKSILNIVSINSDTFLLSHHQPKPPSVITLPRSVLLSVHAKIGNPACMYESNLLGKLGIVNL